MYDRAASWARVRVPSPVGLPACKMGVEESCLYGRQYGLVILRLAGSSTALCGVWVCRELAW